jgi:2-C-methyl-D-erythritol 4-phosphate cytidylyltransferase
MHKKILIVAGGAGTRMEMKTPKQFILLNGLPVLMHTIKRFYEFDQGCESIIVLPEDKIPFWNQLIIQYSFTIKHRVVAGGESRFHSVQNGLKTITENCLIAVHDGVRPFCSTALINRCFESAEKNTNGIPAIQVSDTIREIKNETSVPVDRNNLRIIQTPQCFNSALLIKAYHNTKLTNFTDDGGVFEADGNKIHLVEGEKNNIKITEQSDLLIANTINQTYFN